MITKEWMEKNYWFVSMFTPEEWASMTDEEKTDGLEEARTEEESERLMDMGDDEAAEEAYYSMLTKREVSIVCLGCKVVFTGQPEYGFCEACADKRESV